MTELTQSLGPGSRPTPQTFRMRTGRHLGRTLYLHPRDQADADPRGYVVGMVDSAYLAGLICEAWNRGETP